MTASEDEVVFTVQDSVAVIRLNRPQKYNGWREKDTAVIGEKLRFCAEDASVRVVILTGTGHYYTAGADIMSSVRLSRPSTVAAYITKYNQGIFDMVLDFPKPILSAVNGPAVGVGVTFSTLTDRVIASSTATFHTPFAKLGLPPEGCSSFNFARLFGEANARILLQEAEKIDAQTALQFGLVHEICEPECLMSRAHEIAQEWVQQGFVRPIIKEGLVPKLKEVNAEESVAFGKAILEPRFFQVQLAKAQEKGKSKDAWVWWTMSKVVPMMSRL